MVTVDTQRSSLSDDDGFVGTGLCIPPYKRFPQADTDPRKLISIYYDVATQMNECRRLCCMRECINESKWVVSPGEPTMARLVTVTRNPLAS